MLQYELHCWTVIVTGCLFTMFSNHSQEHLVKISHKSLQIIKSGIVFRKCYVNVCEDLYWKNCIYLLIND